MTVTFEDHHIAIIGMACHLPQARTPGQYWDNLKNGVVATQSYSDEELLSRGVSQELLRHPDYVKRGVRLSGHDQFDAGFFGLGSREAAMMDPQHRHFLETCWEALEDAGTIPGRYDGDIGVFAGSGHNAYMPYNLLTNAALMRGSDLFEIRHTSNDKDFLTTRVSYCLNLTGLSVNVQTACSTSLVAVHLGCQSLINGECDMVLAGGVTIEHPHGLGYLYREGEVLSPDGSCRAFDANSRGTIFGSGAGVVVLKSANQAIADGDRIHAVILASALNNDGAGKAGYMAPSVDGQAAVVEETLELAGIDAETVTYMEAHGTGTALGDPIELAALNQVYRPRTDQRGYCALGSVKPNIGHLDTAAGVASLIKVVMALKNRTVPGMAHFTEPNADCDFDDSPFFVTPEPLDWNPECGVRRAGVSSLGVGGTNAHVLLEEAPADERAAPANEIRAFPLAARSADELRQLRRELADFLEQDTATRLDDLATTLQRKRAQFGFRCGHAASGRDELVAALREPTTIAESGDKARPVSFLFAGGGSQRSAMGAQLYRQLASYRQDADRCLAALDAPVAQALRTCLFDPDAESDASLQRPSLSLPAIFLTQYCMARLWIAMGQQPAALIGHSLGDYAAACISGVFTAEQAMALVQLRGRLLESLEQPAAMTSVQAEAATIEALCLKEVSVAAINAPDMVLLSGTEAGIENAESLLEAQDISCRRVPIRTASHCSLLDPVLPEFRDFVASMDCGELQIPIVNCRTGDWLTNDQATSPDYWVEHFRHTVYFSRGLEFLANSGDHLLLEIGPGTTLSTFVRQHDFGVRHPTFASLPKTAEEDELRFTAQCLLDLWSHGAEVSWDALPWGQGPGRTTSLPPYPFARQVHWVEGGKGLFIDAAPGEEAAAEGLRLTIPAWKEIAVGNDRPAQAEWIQIGDGADATSLAEAIGDDCRSVIRVAAPGDDGTELADAIQSASSGDGEIGLLYQPRDEGSAADRLTELLTLCKTFGELDSARPLRLCVLTTRARQVTAEAIESPLAALLDPALRVAASEIPALSVLSIDLDSALGAQWRRLDTARRVLPALALLEGDQVPAWRLLALRGGRLFETDFRVPQPTEQPVRLKNGGRYLVIGANGSIGRSLVEHLRHRYGARLCLAVRSLPPIAGFVEALDAGDTVHAQTIDLLDADSVAACLAFCDKAFGGLDGVFQLAGTLDVDLIQVKSPQSMAAVLAPKVEANQVLADVLGDRDIDFVMAFSSISGYIGMPGQFEYAAANGFVDAFARQQQQRGRPWTAVAWTAWANAGWLTLDSGNRRQLADSLFHHRADTEDGRVKLWRSFASDEDWELLEHRTTTGIGVMPGTGYAALAIAAWRELSSGFKPVIVEDLSFVEAFALRSGERAEICVELEHQGERWEFNISSANGSVEHARGSLRAAAITAAIEETPARPGDPVTGILEHPFVQFGPRWSNIDSAYRDGSRVSLSLSLDPAFHGDLAQYDLHPSLHDVAVGGAQVPAESNHGAEMLIPFSYERIEMLAPLTPSVRVHARLKSLDEQFAVIDYEIFSDKGHPLVLVRNFSMRKIDPAGFEQLQSSLPPAAQDQISFEEGVQAVELALTGVLEPNLLVSRRSVASIISEACRAAGEAASASGQGDSNRPELSTPFAAPETEIEVRLAELWGESLGISPVGVDDDFFELGGHSLLLARVSTKAQKLLGKRVAAKSLFEKPSLRSWATTFAGEQSEPEPGNKIKRVSRDKYLRK